MQQTLVIAVLLLWLLLSTVVSLHFFPDGSCPGLYVLLALFCSLPFLLRPLAWAERKLRPAMTLIRHRRTRAWVHLAPWQPTTNLTPARVCQFQVSVNTSTCQALEKHHTVIISSHLLTGIRARRLLACTAKQGFTVHCRTFRLPFTPAMKALMQLEILFRQWRWRKNFRNDWPVLVLRKKSLKPEIVITLLPPAEPRHTGARNAFNTNQCLCNACVFRPGEASTGVQNSQKNTTEDRK